jgi:hypothetical protein
VKGQLQKGSSRKRSRKTIKTYSKLKEKFKKQKECKK